MRRSLAVAGVLLTAASLLAWLVIFLAGTDVWHDTGRTDFWHLQGVPYDDLRVAAYAFYMLFAGLAVSLAVQVASIVGARRS